MDASLHLIEGVVSVSMRCTLVALVSRAGVTLWWHMEA